MALADWLNPATPQPTYLTSRAAGVVVPEFYKAASEVRKNALGLASDEQSLRVNEERAQRERDADVRRKAEEAAAAAVMPRLSQLDPTSRNYFGELSKIMAEPGGANALANQSVRSFLDIGAGARSESQRLQDQATDKANRIEQEARSTQSQIAAEERTSARSNVEGFESLALKYADDLGADDFLNTYTPALDKLREVQRTAPDKVAPMLSKLNEDLNRDYNQRLINKTMLGYGVSPDVIAKIKAKDGGKFGDYAQAELGRLRSRPSPTMILQQRLDGLETELKNPALSRAERQILLDRYDELLRNGGTVSTDAAADFNRLTGGPKAKGPEAGNKF